MTVQRLNENKAIRHRTTGRPLASRAVYAQRSAATIHATLKCFDSELTGLEHINRPAASRTVARTSQLSHNAIVRR